MFGVPTVGPVGESITGAAVVPGFLGRVGETVELIGCAVGVPVVVGGEGTAGAAGGRVGMKEGSGMGCDAEGAEGAVGSTVAADGGAKGRCAARDDEREKARQTSKGTVRHATRAAMSQNARCDTKI